MLKLRVPEMSCGHCAATIEKAVKAIDSKAYVKVDLASLTVTVGSRVSDAQIAEAIKAAGFASERIGV